MIHENITNVANYLKYEFKMKDGEKIKYCLVIWVNHLSSKIFVDQSTYTKKVLDRFYMDKYHPLTIPIIVQSLEVENGLLYPRNTYKEILGYEVPYLSVISVLIILQITRADIVFVVNLLTKIRF